jgi:D-alanyl-D-alanine carboxypeptidase
MHPDEYGQDAEQVNTDEKLREQGWAAGMDVWGQVEKAYDNYLGDGVLANAQLWSLRQAIRAELLAELEQRLRFTRAAARHACSDSVDEWNDMIEVWNTLPGAVQRELLS